MSKKFMKQVPKLTEADIDKEADKVWRDRDDFERKQDAKFARRIERRVRRAFKAEFDDGMIL